LPAGPSFKTIAESTRIFNGKIFGYKAILTIVNTTEKTILGIDFGTKRIGLALSRPGSSMAFPERVVNNTNSALLEICKVITDEAVEVVVIGESLNLNGSDNILMSLITAFKADIETNNPDIQIYLEPEHYSSAQARRWQGKHKDLDAAAASIILQAWIDRQNFGTDAAI